MTARGHDEHRDERHALIGFVAVAGLFVVFFLIVFFFFVANMGHG